MDINAKYKTGKTLIYKEKNEYIIICPSACQSCYNHTNIKTFPITVFLFYDHLIFTL